jgi:hypothetical protein
MTKIFPTIIIVLMAIASAIYFCHGEIKQGVFWAALATANWCVVY